MALSHWRRGGRRAVGLLARRPDLIRRDADEELASLLDERTADFILQGMLPDAARAEALRRLGGDVDAVRTRLHRSAARREHRLGAREWGAGLAHDLRYAARGLVREPLFTTFAVLTLALGIGANAAMFGVVDALLLRGPAHVREPERVVRLYWTMRRPGGEIGTTAAFDPRVYANLLVESRAFAEIAMQTAAGRAALVGEGDGARLVAVSTATADLMTVLGARPLLGRFFTRDEQEADTPPAVVVLGYQLWQSDFGGAGDVVGRTIAVSGRPHTIVGVAPRGFTGAALDRVDLWRPLRAKTDAAARHWERGHSSGPAIIARLRPGVTRDQASRDATDAYRRSYDGDEREYAEASLAVSPLHYGFDGAESTEARIARWLAGVAAVVLLVACANLVNLLLARAVRRRREVAVRLALGVSTGRLVRLLLANSLLLAALGAVSGLAVASVVGATVRRVLLPDVDWTTGPVDGRVLLFSLAATVVTGLAIGVLPALRARRTEVASTLKDGGDRGGRVDRGGALVRRSLTVAQAALAMLLLVGAGLFVRSLDRVRRLDLGVQADRVVTLAMRRARLAPTVSDSLRAVEERRRALFASTALESLAGMRAVEHAAVAVGLPFGNVYGFDVRIPGRDSLPRLSGGFGYPDVSAVTADYFATVGTRLVRGRLFTAADRAGSAPVAIVSATMARTLWPGSDALGQCLLVNRATTCTQIVGVVQDARRGRIREDPVMHYYLPLGQQTMLTDLELLVRPRGAPAAAIPALRARLRALDPTILFVDAATLQERVDPQTRSWRVGALMFSTFAALALVVGAVGTFAVVAYVVERRRHEIGVRIALGASAGRVVRYLVRGALGATGAGVAVGAVVALAAGRLAEPLLFETSARDPLVFGVVGAALVLVSFVASAVPALRARHVDPIAALRDE